MRPSHIAICALFLSGMIVSNAGAQAPRDQNPDGFGMTVQEFRQFARDVPDMTGRIQEIKMFSAENGASDITIMTYSSKIGWQMYVFGRNARKDYELTWASGPLGDKFSVGLSTTLRTVYYDEGLWAIKFLGCARHVCPDIFSVLLYIPSKRAGFIGTYTWGKISYSANADTPENQKIKFWLKSLLLEHYKEITPPSMRHGF